MKKEQKEQVKGFVKLLEDLHTALHRALKIRDQKTAMELLGQCQSIAIALGETIEGTAGEELAAIPLIERYCELVYQIFEQVRLESGAINGDMAYNCLAKQLIQIRNRLKTERSLQISSFMYLTL